MDRMRDGRPAADAEQIGDATDAADCVSLPAILAVTCISLTSG